MIIGVYMFPTLKTISVWANTFLYSATVGTSLHDEGLVWALMGFLPIAFAIGWIVMPLINAFRERKSKPSNPNYPGRLPGD
jgi:hypothetical protein